MLFCVFSFALYPVFMSTSYWYHPLLRFFSCSTLSCNSSHRHLILLIRDQWCTHQSRLVHFQYHYELWNGHCNRSNISLKFLCSTYLKDSIALTMYRNIYLSAYLVVCKALCFHHLEYRSMAFPLERFVYLLIFTSY